MSGRRLDPMKVSNRESTPELENSEIAALENFVQEIKNSRTAGGDRISQVELRNIAAEAIDLFAQDDGFPERYLGNLSVRQNLITTLAIQLVEQLELEQPDLVEELEKEISMLHVEHEVVRMAERNHRLHSHRNSIKKQREEDFSALMEDNACILIDEKFHLHVKSLYDDKLSVLQRKERAEILALEDELREIALDLAVARVSGQSESFSSRIASLVGRKEVQGLIGKYDCFRDALQELLVAETQKKALVLQHQYKRMLDAIEAIDCEFEKDSPDTDLLISAVRSVPLEHFDLLSELYGETHESDGDLLLDTLYPRLNDRGQRIIEHCQAGDSEALLAEELFDLLLINTWDETDPVVDFYRDKSPEEISAIEQAYRISCGDIEIDLERNRQAEQFIEVQACRSNSSELLEALEFFRLLQDDDEVSEDVLVFLRAKSHERLQSIAACYERYFEHPLAEALERKLSVEAFPLASTLLDGDVERVHTEELRHAFEGPYGAGRCARILGRLDKNSRAGVLKCFQRVTGDEFLCKVRSELEQDTFTESEKAFYRELSSGGKVQRETLLRLSVDNARRVGRNLGEVLSLRKKDEKVIRNARHLQEELLAIFRDIFPDPTLRSIIERTQRHSADRAQFEQVSREAHLMGWRTRKDAGLHNDNRHWKNIRSREYRAYMSRIRIGGLFRRLPAAEKIVRSHYDRSWRETDRMINDAIRIASNLYHAMKGFGVNEAMVMRVLEQASQSKEKLGWVKAAFEGLASDSLCTWLKSNLGGAAFQKANRYYDGKHTRREFNAETEVLSANSILPAVDSEAVLAAVVSAAEKSRAALKLRETLHGTDVVREVERVFSSYSGKDRQPVLQEYARVFGSEFSKDIVRFQGDRRIVVATQDEKPPVVDREGVVLSLLRNGRLTDRETDIYINICLQDISDERAQLRASDEVRKLRKEIDRLERDFREIQENQGEFYENHPKLQSEHEVRWNTANEQLYLSYVLERVAASAYELGLEKAKRKYVQEDAVLWARQNALDVYLTEQHAQLGDVAQAVIEQVIKRECARAMADMCAAEKGAQSLHAAMKKGWNRGFRSDGSEIRQILKGLSEQRMVLAVELYSEMYDASLYHHLRGALGHGDFSAANAIVIGDGEAEIASRLFNALRSRRTDVAELNEASEALHQHCVLEARKEFARDHRLEFADNQELDLFIHRAQQEFSELVQKRLQRFEERFIHDFEFGAHWDRDSLWGILKAELSGDDLRLVELLIRASGSIDAAVVRAHRDLNKFWGPGAEVAGSELENLFTEEGVLDRDRMDQFLATYKRIYGVSFRSHVRLGGLNGRLPVMGRDWLLSLVNGDKVAADAHKFRYCLAGGEVRQKLLRRSVSLHPKLQKKLREIDSDLHRFHHAAPEGSSTQLQDINPEYKRGLAYRQALLLARQKHIDAVREIYRKHYRCDLAHSLRGELSEDNYAITMRLLQGDGAFDLADKFRDTLGSAWDGTEKQNILQILREMHLSAEESSRSNPNGMSARECFLAELESVSGCYAERYATSLETQLLAELPGSERFDVRLLLFGPAVTLEDEKSLVEMRRADARSGVMGGSAEMEEDYERFLEHYNERSGGEKKVAVQTMLHDDPLAVALAEQYFSSCELHCMEKNETAAWAATAVTTVAAVSGTAILLMSSAGTSLPTTASLLAGGVVVGGGLIGVITKALLRGAGYGEGRALQDPGLVDADLVLLPVGEDGGMKAAQKETSIPGKLALRGGAVIGAKLSSALLMSGVQNDTGPGNLEVPLDERLQMLPVNALPGTAFGAEPGSLLGIRSFETPTVKGKAYLADDVAEAEVAAEVGASSADVRLAPLRALDDGDLSATLRRGGKGFLLARKKELVQVELAQPAVEYQSERPSRKGNAIEESQQRIAAIDEELKGFDESSGEEVDRLLEERKLNADFLSAVDSSQKLSPLQVSQIEAQDDEALSVLERKDVAVAGEPTGTVDQIVSDFGNAVQESLQRVAAMNRQLSETQSRSDERGDRLLEERRQSADILAARDPARKEFHSVEAFIEKIVDLIDYNEALTEDFHFTEELLLKAPGNNSAVQKSCQEIASRDVEAWIEQLRTELRELGDKITDSAREKLAGKLEECWHVPTEQDFIAARRDGGETAIAEIDWGSPIGTLNQEWQIDPEELWKDANAVTRFDAGPAVGLIADHSLDACVAAQPDAISEQQIFLSGIMTGPEHEQNELIARSEDSAAVLLSERLEGKPRILTEAQAEAGAANIIQKRVDASSKAFDDLLLADDTDSSQGSIDPIFFEGKGDPELKLSRDIEMKSPLDFLQRYDARSVSLMEASSEYEQLCELSTVEPMGEKVARERENQPVSESIAPLPGDHRGGAARFLMQEESQSGKSCTEEALYHEPFPLHQRTWPRGAEKVRTRTRTTLRRARMFHPAAGFPDEIEGQAHPGHRMEKSNLSSFERRAPGVQDQARRRWRQRLKFVLEDD